MARYGRNRVVVLGNPRLTQTYTDEQVPDVLRGLVPTQRQGLEDEHDTTGEADGQALAGGASEPPPWDVD